MLWKFYREIIAVILVWFAFSILQTQGTYQPLNLPLAFHLADYQQSFSREIILENMRLRTLLNWPEPETLNLAGAGKVIALDPVGLPCWLTVEVGKLEGNAPTLTVLDRNGNLVGQVVERKNGRLTVMTILNPESRVSVLLQESRNMGILSSSEMPVNLTINYISPESPVYPGEVAVTSRMSAHFPPGIPVGTLQQATRNRGLFQKVTLKPRVNFSTLEEVFIVY